MNVVLKMNALQIFIHVYRMSANCIMILFFYSIGGEGLSVEIDETINARRKYNKGRISPQCWVFGGICRETKIAFAQIVPNRSSETLIPIIQERIMDGSTLYSDEWRSYDIIEKLNNN